MRPLPLPVVVVHLLPVVVVHLLPVFVHRLPAEAETQMTPPDGGSEHDGYSVPGTWPSYCNSHCAPGDAPLGETVKSDTVKGEILLLPDENPPTDL